MTALSPEDDAIARATFGAFQKVRWPHDPGYAWDHPATAKSRAAWAAAGKAGAEASATAQPVPELGAVAYEAAETGALRDLLAEIIAEFSTATGEWHLAGVSREQIAKWRKRAGLED